MGDTALATAIPNRLLHLAHVVNIRGDSYRMKERRKAGGTFYRYCQQRQQTRDDQGSQF